MKRFENVKLPLFDSSNGNFKVSVEVQLSRKNPDGSFRDLVYATDKYTGVFNPNIYLIFSYKSDDAQPIYMSYPQLYVLRKTFRKLSKILDSEDPTTSAFLKDENGVLSVNAKYADPVVIENIGKNNNWISLQFQVIQSGENGVVNYYPGVTIQLSTSNGYTSLLTEEEFHTVETIVNDIDLASISCSVSLAYLACDQRVMYQQYYQPQMPQMAPQQPQYPRYQAPMQQQGYMQPVAAPAPQQQGYIRPRFNSAPAAPNYQKSYRATADAPQVPQAPQPTPAPQQMAPRPASTPIMNLKDVEATPVSEFSYDDADLINQIFDTNEN